MLFWLTPKTLIPSPNRRLDLVPNPSPIPTATPIAILNTGMCIKANNTPLVPTLSLTLPLTLTLT